MEQIFSFLQDWAYRIVWGPVTLIALLLIGGYFSVTCGWIQLFHMNRVIKKTIGDAIFSSRKKKKGSISAFQALSTALAGTIGTGNIAGVATAITLAGPGAIFWMWVSSFLGMMTKYAEIVLAIQYRHKNSKGEWVGGPMYFIRDGLNRKWLAGAYAALGIAASFGVGNMAQVNAISSSMKTAFNLPELYTGIGVALITGIVLAGGLKSLSAVTERLVPFVSAAYILASILVIAVHYTNIPYAFSLIFSGAFSPAAPIGGFAGATVATAFQKGISRGIFTNEAGLGSASIAHAAADTDHPVRQGLWGIFEVFFDTIVMCTITAVAILASGVWHNGLSGTDLTISAFETVFPGSGKYMIALSIALFAFMTLLAWSYYGKKCVEFLKGEKACFWYLLLFLFGIVGGAILELQVVWELSDLLNGLMVVPNLIGLILLRATVNRLTKEGRKKLEL